MRGLVAVALTGFVASSAHAQDGNANSFCPLSPVQTVSDTHVFTVSSDMATELGSSTIDTFDLIRYMDTIVERIMRSSRARQRTRISNTSSTQCEPGACKAASPPTATRTPWGATSKS